MVNLSIGHQTPLRKEPTITLHYLIRLLIHESIVISRFESGTSHLFKGQASRTSAVELLEPRQLLYLRETLWEFGALGMATVRPTIVSIKMRNLSCQNSGFLKPGQFMDRFFGCFTALETFGNG